MYSANSTRPATVSAKAKITHSEIRSPKVQPEPQWLTSIAIVAQRGLAGITRSADPSWPLGPTPWSGPSRMPCPAAAIAIRASSRQSWGSGPPRRRGADPPPPPVRREGGGAEIQRGDCDWEDEIHHAHRLTPTREHDVVADHAGRQETRRERDPSESRQPSWWHLLRLPPFLVARGARSQDHLDGDQVLISLRSARPQPRLMRVQCLASRGRAARLARSGLARRARSRSPPARHVQVRRRPGLPRVWIPAPRARRNPASRTPLLKPRSSIAHESLAAEARSARAAAHKSAGTDMLGERRAIRRGLRWPALTRLGDAMHRLGKGRIPQLGPRKRPSSTEREGFEPSMDGIAHTGFRDRRIQPLCHLSGRPITS
jgi:hypothetical protein